MRKVHELVEKERRLDDLAWVFPLCCSRLTHGTRGQRAGLVGAKRCVWA